MIVQTRTLVTSLIQFTLKLIFGIETKTSLYTVDHIGTARFLTLTRIMRSNLIKTQYDYMKYKIQSSNNH